ncbi:uncharacterized protein LOC129957613 [Argiope bruennichi]|uniref:uncharacterized protein LOC129957613 n=1 Tax=Argiope bruennichi TaxID=94029 RepID=UPI0024957BA3|nr:uncharacterized protein LOC129957613 [Argiope bruennichi]XP_055926007.1 uncharacterized protein LOC129957613 [Argiope bruennichi]
MDEGDDDDISHRSNETEHTTRGRSPTRIPYFIPRRPRVVKMRDLSPATREFLTKEYFDAYDPWTGIRIAATLGILISLFTLFLIYKSRFNRSRNALPTTKKTTSLYLYDDMDLGDCELGSISSSGGRSAYGLSFAYKGRPDEPFRFEDAAGFQLEEVFVKPSVVALKVHTSGKRPSKSGPKFGTLRITEDASRSLPCSPYKLQKQQQQQQQQQQQGAQNTDVKEPASPTTSTGANSMAGSIASFGSADISIEEMERKPAKEICSKHGKKLSKKKDEAGKTVPKSIVVTAKRPQDYRSRSTIVSIARRQRRTS